MPDTSSKRIAVLRALQLGDTLCAIPALRALRDAYPAARITLVALPWARLLLDRYEGLVDELIEFPGYPGMPERAWQPVRVGRFLAAMQRRHLDLAVQLHGAGSITNPLISLFGARSSIGAYRPGEWWPGDGFIPYREDLLEVARVSSVVAAHTGEPITSAPDFPLREEDSAEITRAVPVLAEAPYACVNPGARDPRRRWPAERFAAVADALAGVGLRILLTGVAEEASLHRSVLERMRGPAKSLAGRLSLGGLAALFSRATLVVTNDSGPSHLAAAVGAPLVTVFITTDPRRWAPPQRAAQAMVGGAAEGSVAGHAPAVSAVLAAARRVLPSAEGRRAA
jgi:ADP-heptose:LPS heptosyltransferase